MRAVLAVALVAATIAGAYGVGLLRARFRQPYTPHEHYRQTRDALARTTSPRPLP